MITKENTLGFEVEKKIFTEIIKGKRNTYTVDIDDYTYRDLLKMVEDVLILRVDELPSMHHGCYYYNNGVFPFVIKESLEHIMLVCEGRSIIGKIVETKFTPKVRFRFGENPGDPSVEDPEGDSCIWSVTFKMVPAE